MAFFHKNTHKIHENYIKILSPLLLRFLFVCLFSFFRQESSGPPLNISTLYQQAGNEDIEVAFEDKECTLVWSLSTPAIYPRPNVTCGHYSFDHEDVVQRLPAGLTLHKFPNGSWTASFSDTHVQVSRTVGR